MIHDQFAQKSSSRIEKELDRMTHELPDMAGLFGAFKELFMEQAAWKAELSSLGVSSIAIDPVSFSQGIPILGKEDFAVPLELLKDGGLRLISTMERGFPKISEQLRCVRKFLETSDASSDDFLVSMRPGKDEQLHGLAQRIKVDPVVVKFVFTQLWKTCANQRIASMSPWPENLDWRKGYCPMCGSWPEISFLEGTEGGRLLRCSFCSHEWRFMRIRCPFCENDDQDRLEFLFSEDRDFEKAELCWACMKYIVSIDLRRRSVGAREIVSLGLVYLDILAQEKGFSPGAMYGWNVL